MFNIYAPPPSDVRGIPDDLEQLAQIELVRCPTCNANPFESCAPMSGSEGLYTFHLTRQG